MFTAKRKKQFAPMALSRIGVFPIAGRIAVPKTRERSNTNNYDFTQNQEANTPSYDVNYRHPLK